MFWLQCVTIGSKCYGWQKLFPNYEENTYSRFGYNGQVEMSSRGDDKVLMLFVSLGVGGDAMANDVPVVCESLCFPGIIVIQR